ASTPCKAPDVGWRNDTEIRTSDSTSRTATTARRLRAERLREGNGCGRGLETDASRTALLLRVRGTERPRLSLCPANVAASGDCGYFGGPLRSGGAPRTPRGCARSR